MLISTSLFLKRMYKIPLDLLRLVFKETRLKQSLPLLKSNNPEIVGNPARLLWWKFVKRQHTRQRSSLNACVGKMQNLRGSYSFFKAFFQDFCHCAVPASLVWNPLWSQICKTEAKGRWYLQWIWTVEEYEESSLFLLGLCNLPKIFWGVMFVVVCSPTYFSGCYTSGLSHLLLFGLRVTDDTTVTKAA